jgi:hypothetical protein
LNRRNAALSARSAQEAITHSKQRRATNLDRSSWIARRLKHAQWPPMLAADTPIRENSHGRLIPGSKTGLKLSRIVD